MKLSIIVPIYNEIKYLPELMKKLLKIDYEKEIIAVDDGSTDGSWEWLKENFDNDVKLLRNETNLGKCAAIKKGIKVATGDVIIIQDADLEYDPENYHELLEPILNGYNVVYGNRNISQNKKYSLTYYLGNLFLSFVTSLLYNCKLRDMETGYKVFRKEVIKKINLKGNRFEFEPEVTAKVVSMGYKIYEVPIKYHPRSRKEGKKITWLDGVKAIFTLLKYKI